MNDDNPYRAPSAAVADVPEIGELQLAGRGHRFGAAMIDGIIYAAMLLPVAYAAGSFNFIPSGIFSFTPDGSQSLSNKLLMAMLGFTLFVLAQSYFLKRNGQTLGKKIVGIRIVNLDDQVPGLGTLLVRRYGPMYLINAVPFLGGLLALVDALFIFGSERRCVHDVIAGTKVVLAGPRFSSATWFLLRFALFIGLSILLGIGAAIVMPQLHAPRTVPAAPKKPGAATAIPAPGPAAADSQSPAAPPNAANEPAKSQGTDTELRKCLELTDPAAVIRCSEGRN